MKKPKKYTTQHYLDAAELCQAEALKAPEKSQFDRSPYDDKTVFKMAALRLLLMAGDKLSEEVKAAG